MYCGKCGSEIDKKTGLCPNCDAAALQTVQEVNNKKSLKKAKRRGSCAIVALILVIAIVASSVVLLFPKAGLEITVRKKRKRFRQLMLHI